MTTLRKVAVFGVRFCILVFDADVQLTRPQASGNFGAPITAALIKAGFVLTIVTRAESTASFPDGLPVIKIEYTPENFVKALLGQDAVVCVVGPTGIHHQTAMIDAAEAAGVKRFIVDDFGWGPDARGLPEFQNVRIRRKAPWDHAKERAEANPGFTWTGITTGNPIDWVCDDYVPENVQKERTFRVLTAQ